MGLVANPKRSSVRRVFFGVGILVSADCETRSKRDLFLSVHIPFGDRPTGTWSRQAAKLVSCGDGHGL